MTARATAHRDLPRDNSTAGASGRTEVRRWFDWHSWIGITGGLLLFLICWSGAFATLSGEFDWLVTPALRVTPSGPPASLEAIHDAVAQSMPEARIRSVLQPAYDRFAADVVVQTASGEVRHVYVDPYTLEVTGTTTYFNLQRFFRDFHMSFYGLLGTGKYVVTLMAVPLIASLVTGLFFYKRWWRRFLEFRSGRGPRALWSSLHKLAGLWSLWFVVIIGVTSLWYLFEQTRVQFIDHTFSYSDASDTALNPLPPIPAEGATSLPFGELIARARAARPDIDIRQVGLDRGGYFYVQGQAGHVLVRDRANKMFIDPRDGSVVYSQNADDLSAYWYWSDMADPLHFGTFGGLATRLIWFVFGLFLSGLAATGAWLHLKRLKKGVATGRYWSGSVTASVLSLSILLFCVSASVVYAIEAGKAPGGGSGGAGGLFFDVEPGVAAFVILWCLATLGCGVYWFRALRRPHRAIVPSASAHP